MTKATSYKVVHLAGRGLDRPTVGLERDSLLELTDVSWRLYFRDAHRGLSCGLANTSSRVEKLPRRRCRIMITDLTDGGVDLEMVLRAPAGRVRRDLDRREADLVRAGHVADAIAAGDWWLNARVFDDLDWARIRSIAGIRYRHGWWGTGRMKPSMSAKVLDCGPGGIRFRGWRTRFLIPWDAIASIRVVEGDAWVLDVSPRASTSDSGATIVVRSRSGQDAVFFTPLIQASVARELLEPVTRNLTGTSPVLAAAATT